MKLIKYSILFLSLLTSSLFAQNLQWQATYNGPADSLDLAQKILVDAAGNVIVTGYSIGAGTARDFTTIKYNSSGVQQWLSRYNGPSNKNDDALSAAIDAAGNIYVCGNSYVNNNTSDICLIKYNSTGNALWTSRFSTASITGEYSLASDNSGNCCITGMYNNDLIVIKYNSAGVQQWSASYNGNANGIDEGRQIIIDASGNVFAAGVSAGGSTEKDIVLIKYNSSGVQQWVSRFNNTLYNKDDIPTALKMDKLGNIYISGFSWNNNSFSQPVLLVCKFNGQGQVLWSQTISSQISFAMANDMVIDNFNNIYVTGSKVTAQNIESLILVKYNSSGVQQWINYYNSTGSSNDCGDRIVTDRLNYIYVQATSKTFSSNNYRVIQKYNSNGNRIWTQSYQGNIQEQGSYNNSSLLIDTNFNVYSTGGNLGNPQTENYITLKYTQPCYTVTGLVTYKDNNQPVQGGYIKALYYDKSSTAIIILDSAHIQSNGTYILNCVHTDSAYFMVYQDDEVLDFVPTYYPSTIDWQQAEKVYVNNNLSNINVQVFRINNTVSPYNISGLTVNNNPVTNYIRDAVIYAKIGNEFKNFAVSINDGSYLLKKLPAGNYTLTAYRMGYNSITQNVSITNGNLSGINFNFSNPIGITINKKIIPGEYTLLQNYPNPFNPSTKITFAIPEKEFVTLTVYDIAGKEIAVLVNDIADAGSHEINFSSSGLSSGIYFYKLSSKQVQITRKMVILK